MLKSWHGIQCLQTAMPSNSNAFKQQCLQTAMPSNSNAFKQQCLQTASTDS